MEHSSAVGSLLSTPKRGYGKELRSEERQQLEQGRYPLRDGKKASRTFQFKPGPSKLNDMMMPVGSKRLRSSPSRMKEIK